MNKSKRFFVCFFIAIFVMTTVTACGSSSDSAAYTAPEDQETVNQNSVESQGEGPVQGGIKSDEEIAALQEEEQQGNATTEYESNEGHEPESFGSGNFQDYWTGEDYFDLESYLKDNGCNYYASTNGEDHKELECGATAYFALFNNSEWEIYIYPYSACSLVYQTPNEDNRLKGYLVYDELALDQIMVTVNDQGTQISKGCLVVLDTIISAIKQYPDDMDPMQYFDTRYVPYN